MIDLACCCLNVEVDEQRVFADTVETQSERLTESARDFARQLRCELALLLFFLCHCAPLRSIRKNSFSASAARAFMRKVLEMHYLRERKKDEKKMLFAVAHW